MSLVFDKLSFVKRLEDAGRSYRPQAETLSEAFHQAVSEAVATKQDVASVRSEMAQLGSDLRHEISQTRIDIQHETSLIRSELKTGLAETRVWTVSVGATIIAVFAAMKYFG